MDVGVLADWNSVDQFDRDRRRMEARDVEALPRLLDRLLADHTSLTGLRRFVVNRNADPLVGTEWHAHVGTGQKRAGFGFADVGAVAIELQLAGFDRQLLLVLEYRLEMRRATCARYHACDQLDVESIFGDSVDSRFAIREQRDS